ncbi:putative CDT1-like protein a, chloroplastic-like [Capsicum annuum]|nr:putative CDT1-like protein a, chloroplastic-like [Capsicum annuum]
MEKQGEIEKGKANNFAVSFSALRRDIVKVEDFMERLKNEKVQNAVDIADQIEKLKLVRAFICTYVQLSYSDLKEFEDIMTGKRQEVDNLLRPILDDVVNTVRCKYNMDHVLPSLMDNIDECIRSCHHSTSSATMTDEQLNFLLLNLHHMSKYRAEKIFPLETQYEILQNSSEDIDVAEKLRKQLYGKRYLIVLDDMWDTTTWNDLTRPFPEAEKGSLEKKKAVWIEVRNNLNSFIFGSEVDVMKVIELSYDHLPHHMKPRILYLASFPKDTAMDRVMLKMYWRAEGIVEQTEMKSLEEEMGIYLDKLISSSLVIAFNEIGDYSSCQLHALVHDFCLIKAREEKWFVQISSSDPSSSSDLMASIVIINYDKEHFKPNNFVLLNSIKKRHSGKHRCSLAITGDKIEDCLPDACHLRDLRLLRVLDLSPSFMMVKNSLLNEICMLNHLRFLNIGTEVKYLPSSFSNLRNLETLVVINEGSTLVLLPSIWDLVKLRVLSIDACCFFDLDADEPILITTDSKLENLRVLETPVLSYAKGIEDIFISFPNLQRFTFVLKESWDYSTERYWFPKLDFLTELEELRVDFETGSGIFVCKELELSCRLVESAIIRHLEWRCITSVRQNSICEGKCYLAFVSKLLLCVFLQVLPLVCLTMLSGLLS